MRVWRKHSLHAITSQTISQAREQILSRHLAWKRHIIRRILHWDWRQSSKQGPSEDKSNHGSTIDKRWTSSMVRHAHQVHHTTIHIAFFQARHQHQSRQKTKASQHRKRRHQQSRINNPWRKKKDKKKNKKKKKRRRKKKKHHRRHRSLSSQRRHQHT